jgi:hypothetical protein
VGIKIKRHLKKQEFPTNREHLFPPSDHLCLAKMRTRKPHCRGYPADYFGIFIISVTEVIMKKLERDFQITFPLPVRLSLTSPHKTNKAQHQATYKSHDRCITLWEGPARLGFLTPLKVKTHQNHDG